MKRSLFGAILGFLMLACTLSAQEGTGKASSTWYPLKKDSVWTFKVDKNAIQMKVTGEDKDGFKLETIVNGKSVASEVVTIKEDGVYRVAINGQKPDTPVKFFALPPKKEASWDVDTKIQGQTIKGKFSMKNESVNVPAGKYETYVVDGKFDIAGMNTDVKYWFAENVGFVKLQFSLGGQDAILELEKYEAGK